MDWSKEFVLTPPKRLGSHSLVFICSHGGNTPETVEAADAAADAGAFVITTHDAESKCADSKYHAIVYKWVDETLQKDKPMCITYAVLNELIHRQEPEYKLYEAMKDGIVKCDQIIRDATNKYQNKAWNFAEHYYRRRFYISCPRELHMHSLTVLLSARCRKCSGWTAAT